MVNNKVSLADDFFFFPSHFPRSTKRQDNETSSNEVMKNPSKPEKGNTETTGILLQHLTLSNAGKEIPAPNLLKLFFERSKDSIT